MCVKGGRECARARLVGAGLFVCVCSFVCVPATLSFTVGTDLQKRT